MNDQSLLINNIIAGAALFLIAINLCIVPFRIKKQGNEGFKNRGSSFWVREAAIFLASIAICVLCIFIHFEIVPTACLCGCGVLASIVGVQELFPKK